jgi:hypothetical protein
MLSWQEFASECPDIAEPGLALLFQHDVGLAFLATISSKGAPRLHPISPLVVMPQLLAFIIPSPKRQDLLQRRMYSMHSFPTRDNDDAFAITGRAAPVTDPAITAAARKAYLAARKLTEAPPSFDTERLFEFLIEGALYTKTRGWADWSPQHRVWHSQG